MAKHSLGSSFLQHWVMTLLLQKTSTFKNPPHTTNSENDGEEHVQDSTPGWTLQAGGNHIIPCCCLGKEKPLTHQLLEIQDASLQYQGLRVSLCDCKCKYLCKQRGNHRYYLPQNCPGSGSRDYHLSYRVTGKYGLRPTGSVASM